MNEYPDYLNPDVPARVDWWWTEEGRKEALAAAEVRGAQAVLAAVEGVAEQWDPSPLSVAAEIVDAARAAAAAAGGGA